MDEELLLKALAVSSVSFVVAHGDPPTLDNVVSAMMAAYRGVSRGNLDLAVQGFRQRIQGELN